MLLLKILFITIIFCEFFFETFMKLLMLVIAIALQSGAVCFLFQNCEVVINFKVLMIFYF